MTWAAEGTSDGEAEGVVLGWLVDYWMATGMVLMTEIHLVLEMAWSSEHLRATLTAMNLVHLSAEQKAILMVQMREKHLV